MIEDIKKPIELDEKSNINIIISQREKTNKYDK